MVDDDTIESMSEMLYDSVCSIDLAGKKGSTPEKKKSRASLSKGGASPTFTFTLERLLGRRKETFFYFLDICMTLLYRHLFCRTSDIFILLFLFVLLCCGCFFCFFLFFFLFFFCLFSMVGYRTSH